MARSADPDLDGADALAVAVVRRMSTMSSDSDSCFLQPGAKPHEGQQHDRGDGGHCTNAHGPMHPPEAVHGGRVVPPL